MLPDSVYHLIILHILTLVAESTSIPLTVKYNEIKYQNVIQKTLNDHFETNTFKTHMQISEF